MSITRAISGLIIFFALNLMAIDQASAAGPPGPPGGGGDPPCWPAPCVPIDGGVSLLLAAGLAYGGKKAYEIIKKDQKL
ncbi:MAG: hypothetical protein COB88_09645 [Flavobacteriales bacterium]|nr:MAG: hypothetical protein COB88_09645 [Flavobacteriales bacterium]